jgi:DtxR family transcriptional regulator, Mn-dependent transcriptional regulator
MDKILTSSMEDYLEVIYLLVKKNKVARAKDIAVHLNVKKPSVTGALRVLSEKGLIKYSPYGFIDITEDGEKAAAKIFRRHEIINQFLSQVLQVPQDKAEEDACKIEHSISDTTLEKLVNFIHFFEHCPRVGEDWIAEFKKVCSLGAKPHDCKACLEQAMKDVAKPRKNRKDLKVISDVRSS